MDANTFPLEQWFFDIPPLTRTYVTAVVAATLACQVDLISPFHLYFNPDLIWKAGQYWRIVTSFLYFGSLSVDFIFHIFFLLRYSRALEEESFRGRTADFIWMLLLAIVSIVGISHALPSSLPFLSQPLTFFLVYLWSRRNPFVRMNFLGLFTFTAPYLPFVLAGFSLLINNHWPVGDMVGMVVAHVYYWGADVWPRVLEERRRTAGLPATPQGEEWSIFKAPAPFRVMVDTLISDRRRQGVDPFATLDAAQDDPMFVPEHRDVRGATGLGLGGGNGNQGPAAGHPSGVVGLLSRILGAVGLAHLVGGPAPRVDGWRRHQDEPPVETVEGQPVETEERTINREEGTDGDLGSDLRRRGNVLGDRTDENGD